MQAEERLAEQIIALEANPESRILYKFLTSVMAENAFETNDYGELRIRKRNNT